MEIVKLILVGKNKKLNQKEQIDAGEANEGKN